MISTIICTFWANARECAIFAGLTVIVHLQACAAALTEEERYRIRALRDQRMDEIHLFIQACEASGNVVTYGGPLTSLLPDPLTRIPRNARVADYGCISRASAQRMRW